MSMSPAPVPKISRAPRFPLVWVVPVIARAVGAGMIAHELRERGPEEKPARLRADDDEGRRGRNQPAGR